MHATRKVKLNDIMPNLTCGICKGYFIEATTIIECLHSFCKSCIVNHLEKSEFCPICDVQLHISKPLSSIRSDQMLQEIVYKLVPGLFQKEMDRRRNHYKTSSNIPASQLDGGQVFNDTYITSDDIIQLSLEYHTNDKKFKESTKRYIKCVAAVSISILKKLIQGKYDLENDAQIDVMFGQRVLPDDFLLMDIAYKYSWTKNGNKPLPLSYRIRGVKFDKFNMKALKDKSKTSKASKPKRTVLKNKAPKDQLTQTPPKSEVFNGKLKKESKPKVKPIKLPCEKPPRKTKVPKKRLVDNSSSTKEVQLQISENGIMCATTTIDSQIETILGISQSTDSTSTSTANPGQVQEIKSRNSTTTNLPFELKIPNPFNNSKLLSNSSMLITPITTNGLLDLKRKLPFNEDKKDNGPMCKKIKIGEKEVVNGHFTSPIKSKIKKKGLSMSESKLSSSNRPTFMDFEQNFSLAERAKMNLFPVITNGKKKEKVKKQTKAKDKSKVKCKDNLLVNGGMKFSPKPVITNGNLNGSPPKKPPKFFKSRHSVSSSTEGSQISNGFSQDVFKTPEKSTNTPVNGQKISSLKTTPTTSNGTSTSTSTSLPNGHLNGHGNGLVNGQYDFTNSIFPNFQLANSILQQQHQSQTAHLTQQHQQQTAHLNQQQQQQNQNQIRFPYNMSSQNLGLFNNLTMNMNLVPFITSNYCSMPFTGLNNRLSINGLNQQQQQQQQQQFLQFPFQQQFTPSINGLLYNPSASTTTTATTTTTNSPTTTPSEILNPISNGMGSMDLSKLASMSGQNLIKSLNSMKPVQSNGNNDNLREIQKEPLSLKMNSITTTSTSMSSKTPTKKTPTKTKSPGKITSKINGSPLSIPNPAKIREKSKSKSKSPDLVSKTTCSDPESKMLFPEWKIPEIPKIKENPQSPSLLTVENMQVDEEPLKDIEKEPTETNVEIPILVPTPTTIITSPEIPKISSEEISVNVEKPQDMEIEPEPEPVVVVPEFQKLEEKVTLHNLDEIENNNNNPIESSAILLSVLPIEKQPSPIKTINGNGLLEDTTKQFSLSDTLKEKNIILAKITQQQIDKEIEKGHNKCDEKLSTSPKSDENDGELIMDLIDEDSNSTDKSLNVKSPLNAITTPTLLTNGASNFSTDCTSA